MNLVAIAGVPVGVDAPAPPASLEYDRHTMWFSLAALGAGALFGYVIWRGR